jgi:hypothetical protein
MISDVLSDAVKEMRRYLAESRCYDGEIRSRLEKLVADMDAMRAELDTPPERKARRKEERGTRNERDDAGVGFRQAGGQADMISRR